MSAPRYPALFQVNTRVQLTELSAALGRKATLDDVPDAELRPAGRDGLRLALAAERMADRPRGSGDLAGERRLASRVRSVRCRTSATTTSPAPALLSGATPSTAISAAMRRSHVCGSGCSNAASC